MPKEKDPDQERRDHDTDQGEQEAELERRFGGPLGRERAMARTRLKRVKKRDQKRDEKDEKTKPRKRRGVAGESEPVEPEEIEESDAAEVPEGFRQELVEEYRKRQQSSEPPSAPTAAADVPQPPQAPPAVNWIPLGPSVVRRGQSSNRPAVSGRVAGFAVASGGTRLYAATAVGGVFRSDDGGTTWRSMMEAWDLDPATRASASLACGAIALHPTNPDRIYVGTGEAVGSLSSYFGVGPIRSDDGGVNWMTEPTAAGSQSLAGTGFFELAVDPGDPERVVAATRVGLYRREPSGGTQVWARKQTGSFSSVVAARSGTTTTFYAATRSGGTVLSSSDGHTWSAVGTGFPTTNVGRIALGVRPSDPTVVYALIATQTTPNGQFLGLWRLDTSDNTWRAVTGAPADLFNASAPYQGWYDMDIAVDPANANRVYLAGAAKSAGGNWCGSIYRCQITSSGSGATLAYSATPTYIGAGSHADVHALVFTPGSSDQLWAGTDGGVFVTNAATTTTSFEARNVGLSSMTMNHLGLHPTEDAVLYAGTQDNGTTRFTGEECWLHSDAGDGGFVVVNWNDPFKVLRTYVSGYIFRATDGGQTYGSWSNVSLPSAHIFNAEFYAPLVGTPRNTSAPAEAETVAFGGIRPWISSTFGGGWQSIPNNDATDDLPSNILSLAFASIDLLYAGTENGEVYRFSRSGTTWTRTAIHATPLLAGPITDIAVDLADASGNSLYVTLGGFGDARRVWRYNGSAWEARSGTGASSLLNVQHNAIVVDPSNVTHLYAGADIGVWRSTDSGANWAPLSNGLPDAPVLDLKIHPTRRLLWAATHGRGVYERRLDATSANAVELYVRDTQLDMGRRPTTNGLADPTNPGTTVRHWAGPDIKVDAPSLSGTYQTPTNQIDFYQFTDVITDESGATLTADPSSTTVINRVYVQVHNRGVQAATNVRVMVLLTNASAGLPNLPAGYDANVRSGTPINTTTWRTVGIVTLPEVRVGYPVIAAFDLPSTMLPPPASLAGNTHQCLLALLHCPTHDEFTNTTTHVDTLSPSERKAAHKNLHVVATASPGVAEPQWQSVQVNGSGEDEAAYDLVFAPVERGPEQVHVVIPEELRLSSKLETSIEGLGPDDDHHADEWVEKKTEQLKEWIDNDRFDREWSEQLMEELAKIRGGRAFVTDPRKARAALKGVVLGPAESHTILFALDLPKGARVGDVFEVAVEQRRAVRRGPGEAEGGPGVGKLGVSSAGGSNYRVIVVPDRDREEEILLKIWGRRTKLRELVHVQVVDGDGRILTPKQGARVGAYAHSQRGVHPELWPMTFDRRIEAFSLVADELPHVTPRALKLTVIASAGAHEARRTEYVEL